jgi:hypothetical protein
MLGQLQALAGLSAIPNKVLAPQLLFFCSDLSSSGPWRPLRRRFRPLAFPSLPKMDTLRAIPHQAGQGFEHGCVGFLFTVV